MGQHSKGHQRVKELVHYGGHMRGKNELLKQTEVQNAWFIPVSPQMYMRSRRIELGSTLSNLFALAEPFRLDCEPHAERGNRVAAGHRAFCRGQRRAVC